MKCVCMRVWCMHTFMWVVHAYMYRCIQRQDVGIRCLSWSTFITFPVSF